MSTLSPSAAYDAVGSYSQDEVNGFSPGLLDRFLDLVAPAGAKSVLDAMAGDGNLTLRLLRYCEARGIPPPECTLLEYSRVQTEFARRQLAGIRASFVWGDVLTMTPNDGGKPLRDASFDRVIIKSANHEIPLDRQLDLCRSLFRVLRPGGRLANLGFLFEDPRERDELREVARVKDTLAGMHVSAAQRHFLTRDEFYGRLADAGFVDIRCGEALDYTIRSEIVARHYFPKQGAERADLEHQAAQAKAAHMRLSGRIRFEGAASIMVCPGEITLARRPSWAESNAKAFRECPYDFLRHIEAHARMLDEVVRHIPDGVSVLDLACGPGLLAERLTSRPGSYLGLDLSEVFITTCRERHGAQPGFGFGVADMNTVELPQTFDLVTSLNALYLPGIEAVKVLRKAHRMLRPGGRLIVTGPTSSESFRKAAPFIRAQLERDGLLGGENEAKLAAVARANDSLLPSEGNYWSVEGMVALLKELGFRTAVAVDTQVFYGFSFMVVADK